MTENYVASNGIIDLNSYGIAKTSEFDHSPIAPGIYPATVKSVMQKTHNKPGKYYSKPKLAIVMTIEKQDGTKTTLPDDIFLCENMIWRFDQFAIATKIAEPNTQYLRSEVLNAAGRTCLVKVTARGKKAGKWEELTLDEFNAFKEAGQDIYNSVKAYIPDGKPAETKVAVNPTAVTPTVQMAPEAAATAYHQPQAYNEAAAKSVANAMAQLAKEEY